MKKRKSSRGMTGKQEKFCLSVIQGLNYSEAYRSAYDTKNMKQSTINRHACSLSRNSKVRAKIEEFRNKVDNKIEEKLIYTALDSFRKFEKAQDMAEKSADIPSFVRAERHKGELAGLYSKEESQNINITIDSIVLSLKNE